MPGQKPNPENEIEIRPVYCLTCGRVYLSRAQRPVCSKCRSRKVVEYSKMGDKSELHSLRVVVGEVCEALKSFETDQKIISEQQNELYVNQRALQESFQSNTQVQSKIVEVLRRHELIPSSKTSRRATASNPDPVPRSEKRKHGKENASGSQGSGNLLGKLNLIKG
ncbi:hypothetical protein MSMTP_2821 [Methanosarcina sp. MTP4]|uniref:hypothetical protein n=1 Tax=Methanosarcina sp. MTP4 TaxID=1434100 RepID=UPI00061574A4|nr:hypothetical protein [Methanosarcina sp. MTP4]AKB26290.1 hypothetical protein MSMTP_2821 [Methanosarcina sp. MTP4]